MLRWQLASLAFSVYLALLAELRPGLRQRARLRILAGAAIGAAVAIAASRLPADGLLNTWFLAPALLLLGYWTSGLLFVAPMAGVERRLLAIDAALGVQTTAARMPRAVAELLEFAYTAVYPLIAIALWAAFQANVTAERFWTVILVIDYLCFGVLPWIQTRPPRSLGVETPWRASWRQLNARVVNASSIQVNTFPSGHAAEGLAAALLAIGGPAPLVAVLFVAAGAVSAGAVLGRYHYAADAIAGWMVALAVYFAL